MKPVGGSLLLPLCVWLPTTALTGEYAQLAFVLPAETEQLIVADSNGDGLNDLIAVGAQSLHLYFQDRHGFDFQQRRAEIRFDSEAVGWDLSDGYGKPASASVIALLDGTTAQVWHIEGNTLQAPELIRTGLPGFISKGMQRLHFSRDLNADGLQDLMVPGAGVINLFINQGDGSYQPPLSIASNMQLRTELTLDRFNQSVGQSVEIPLLELRDVNGDGANDLISRTDQQLAVFIAQPADNAYWPPQPSWLLDIAALEQRLGEFDIDKLDFANLTGVLALTHEEILQDVDGDGIDDLLLREGGKVSLFKGTDTGMDLSTPRQVLRSGGNVLSALLHDENEDGLQDLWLWRVEAISVGDVFVWMALAGSIAIEAFVYRNDGERFARRPARKITVDLQFPSVMRLAGAYEDLSAQLNSPENPATTPITTAELQGNPERAELLALVDNQLQVLVDAIAPPGTDEDGFLAGLGYSREQDHYRIDVREILANATVSGAGELHQVQGSEADWTVVLDPVPDPVKGTAIDMPLPAADIFATRINGDNMDDVLVLGQHDTGRITGILLLSQ